MVCSKCKRAWPESKVSGRFRNGHDPQLNHVRRGGKGEGRDSRIRGRLKKIRKKRPGNQNSCII